MTLIQYRLEMTCVFVLGFLRADLNPVSPFPKSVVFQRYQVESWGVCQSLSFLASPEFFFPSTVRLPKVPFTCYFFFFCFKISTLLVFGLLPPYRLGFSKYPEDRSRIGHPDSLFVVAFSLES